MALYVYYRVHDKLSATRFDEEDGFDVGEPQLLFRMFTRPGQEVLSNSGHSS